MWHNHIVLFDLTGIVPASTLLLDVYWKEMDADADTDWVNHSIASFYLLFSKLLVIKERIIDCIKIH